MLGIFRRSDREEALRAVAEANRIADFYRQEADRVGAELSQARTTLAEIRYLHVDSVAGFCPSCGRISEISDTDDGLVAYPCPTMRLIDPQAAADADARQAKFLAAVEAAELEKAQNLTAYAKPGSCPDCGKPLDPGQSHTCRRPASRRGPRLEHNHPKPRTAVQTRHRGYDPHPTLTGEDQALAYQYYATRLDQWPGPEWCWDDTSSMASGLAELARARREQAYATCRACDVADDVRFERSQDR
jgi:hypothetical protein